MFPDGTDMGAVITDSTDCKTFAEKQNHHHDFDDVWCVWCFSNAINPALFISLILKLFSFSTPPYLVLQERHVKCPEQ